MHLENDLPVRLFDMTLDQVLCSPEDRPSQRDHSPGFFVSLVEHETGEAEHGLSVCGGEEDLKVVAG